MPTEVLVLLHDSLATFPAFLRFGHLVILERHDQDLTARTKFLEIRRSSLADLADRFWIRRDRPAGGRDARRSGVGADRRCVPGKGGG